MTTMYIPAPYVNPASGGGGIDGLIAAGVLLLVAIAVIVSLVWLNRPVARPTAQKLPTEVSPRLPKAA